MCVHQLYVSLYMVGHETGALLVMIWRVIFIGIIKCVQNIIKIDNLNNCNIFVAHEIW